MCCVSVPHKVEICSIQFCMAPMNYEIFIDFGYMDASLSRITKIQVNTKASVVRAVK